MPSCVTTEELHFSVRAGTADPDETISETLMNNVKEETGTTIEKIKQMLGMGKRPRRENERHVSGASGTAPLSHRRGQESQPACVQ